MANYCLVLAILAAVLGADLASAQIMSYDEFSNALTWTGYPQPSWEQFQAFTEQAGPSGNIWDKQEAAMALAQYIHESDGLRAKREYRCQDNGCPGEYETPGCDVGGQDYYGRGYIQLTWCENYRAFSRAQSGNDWLISDPDAIARDEFLAWDAAFWFWRINVHDREGVSQGWFGATTNAINGALECSGPNQDIARLRFDRYKVVRSALNLGGEAVERGCYN